MITLPLSFAILWMGVTSDIVSKGKPTFQSSVFSENNWPGSLAVDGGYGNNANSGSCFHSNLDEMPFLIVDLNGSFTIDRIIIYNRQDCCGEKMIDVVIELLSQTDQVVHECEKISDNRDIYNIPCGNNVAQKVRVKGVSNQYLHFCELEVHGEPVPLLISRGKPTSHSSVTGDMDGSLAVDGRYDNFVNKDDKKNLKNCFLSNQQEMPFFVVDLQETFKIDQVVLFNREDCCQENMVGVVVQLLYTDGSLSHECETITESKAIYNISCGKNVAQKVRVFGAPNGILQLCEVDVYGILKSLPEIVSRKKPTSESSSLDILNASLAVDGNYNNFIHRTHEITLKNCFHSSDIEKPFMMVDLQGKYIVNYVVIYNRMDCCSQRMAGTIVELLFQNDSVSHQCGELSDTHATYNISCGDKVAHKVHIKGKSMEHLQVCELDVFGESASSLISRKKPTSSSSVNGSMDGSFAVDGRYEYDVSNKNDVNLFHSNRDGAPFWTVDLQGKFAIDHVAIYNRMDCCSKIMIGATIELLTETGEVGHECGKIADTRAVYKIPCEKNVAYKVRIKGAANQFLHFTEVDVFGDTPE